MTTDLILIIATWITVVAAVDLAALLILIFLDEINLFSVDADFIKPLMSLVTIFAFVLFPTFVRERVVQRGEAVVTIESVSESEKLLIVGLKDPKDGSPNYQLYTRINRTLYDEAGEMYTLEYIDNGPSQLIQDREISYYRWRIWGGLYEPGENTETKLGGKIKISKSLINSSQHGETIRQLPEVR